jgi:ketosteroid isomerase-like protein
MLRAFSVDDALSRMLMTVQARLPMTVYAALLGVCLTATLPAASDSSADIRSVLSAQVDAWNRGDIDGYMNGYARSDATEFISGDTLTRGWKTVRDRYARKYDNREKMGTLSFSDVHVSMLGDDAALAVGRWKLQRKNDKPHGRFTLLFRRSAGDWRIVHDHTSAATP